jgi:hypothetical protein
LAPQQKLPLENKNRNLLKYGSTVELSSMIHTIPISRGLWDYLIIIGVMHQLPNDKMICPHTTQGMKMYP